MNEIFELGKTKRAVRNQYKLNLEVPIINQVTFRAKSIRYAGPKTWNSLPFHIKSSESFTTFKSIIKNWDTVSCKCPICQCLSTAVIQCYMPYKFAAWNSKMFLVNLVGTFFG